MHCLEISQGVQVHGVLSLSHVLTGQHSIATSSIDLCPNIFKVKLSYARVMFSYIPHLIIPEKLTQPKWEIMKGLFYQNGCQFGTKILFLEVKVN